MFGGPTWMLQVADCSLGSVTLTHIPDDSKRKKKTDSFCGQYDPADAKVHEVSVTDTGLV